MRRFGRLAAAAVAAAALTGCDPTTAIEVVFHRHGPHVVEQAKRVSWCESRWNNDAVSPAGHVTMWQFDLRYHSHRPGMDRRHEPLFATLAAESLYKESGWSQWSCQP